MKISNHELQEIINGNPVGEIWPYFGGDENDIEAHLRATTKKLEENASFKIDGEFDHYGSGYASYVHLFCRKLDEASSYKREDRTWVDGIAIYLSRLAPFAIFGPETRSYFRRGSSHGFLELSTIGEIPDSSWDSDKAAIESILDDSGYEIVPKSELEKPLPFKANIKTNFDNKNCFDAIFYWED